MDRAQKARHFLTLHEGPDLLVMPNPWDAGSAKLLASLGFKALATTSSGFAYTLARPDGLAAVSLEETLANARAIAEASAVPVSADLEFGFSGTAQGCAETIRLAIEAGLAGGSIEDSTGDADRPVRDIGEATERVRAAAEAAHGAEPFVLTARAENFLYDRNDLGDTIRRLQAYQEAGADVLFAPGLKSADDIRAVVSSVDRPVNVLMGSPSMGLTVDDVAELGVRRISVGGVFARAAIGALMRAARELRDTGTFGFAADALSYDDAQKAFGG